MENDPSTFLHVLVFQCSECGQPVLQWVLTEYRSVEEIDGRTYTPKCSCGWSDRRLGAEARRHMVAPWSACKNATTSNVAAV